MHFPPTSLVRTGPAGSTADGFHDYLARQDPYSLLNNRRSAGPQQAFYQWRRCYEADGPGALRDGSKLP
jgi:hypothetical protein